MQQSIKKSPQYWLLRSLSLLPMSWLYALAHLARLVLWHTNSREKRITLLNIGHCFPDISEAKKQSLAKQSILETAFVAVEMMKLIFEKHEKLSARVSCIEGKELINQAIEKGHGVIILAPHLGSWEYLGVYLAEHFNILNMYKPSDNKLMNQLVIRYRTQNGAGLAPTSKKGIVTVIKHLKNQGVTGILPDQVPDDPSSWVSAPFFGQNAPTMSLASSLCSKPNITAVAAFAKRVKGGKFEVIIKPVAEGIYSKDKLESVAALNKAVEDLVLLAPEQYQWEYKRFKWGEDGKKHPMYRK